MAPLASVQRRVIVGLVAFVILVLGALTRPATPAATAPTEAPAPILQQVVQQREAETVFRRMREAWPQVAPFTARVTAPIDPTLIGPADPADVSGRFGVVAGPRQILADAAHFERGRAVMVTLGNGRAFEARISAAFPERSLAVLEVNGAGALDLPPRADRVTAGTVAFAGARRLDGDVIAPFFIAHVSGGELLTTNALDAFRGMPVFTLEGALVGIVAQELGRLRLLTLDAAMQPPAAPAGTEAQP
jgi:hypothetical protein